MRTPGVEPGSQAWEACMMPLHYVRSCAYFLELSIHSVHFLSLKELQRNSNVNESNASAGNRTRVTSMATMYSTTRPLMLLALEAMLHFLICYECRLAWARLVSFQFDCACLRFFFFLARPPCIFFRLSLAWPSLPLGTFGLPCSLLVLSSLLVVFSLSCLSGRRSL